MLAQTSQRYSVLWMAICTLASCLACGLLGTGFWCIGCEPTPKFPLSEEVGGGTWLLLLLMGPVVAGWHSTWTSLLTPLGISAGILLDRATEADSPGLFVVAWILSMLIFYTGFAMRQWVALERKDSGEHYRGEDGAESHAEDLVP